MRRLKLKIEQKNIEKANHLGEEGVVIFKEHRQLKEDLMADQKI
jgi:hypothetical protein